MRAATATSAVGADGTEWTPRIVVLHGPDRSPLEPPGGAPGAFHGVISRGLMEELGPAAAPDWERWAPWMDAALAGTPAALAVVPAAVVDAARRCEWTTLLDGAEAAVAFAAASMPPLLRELAAGFGPDRVEAVELWLVKEGHTSSVWRAAVTPPGGGEPVCAALNVARDAAAGAELLQSAEELERVRAATDVRVARVLGTGASADGAPAVVAQEWVDGARELAFLRRRDDGLVRLHAIERFITDEHSPAQLTGAVGRVLDGDEHEAAAHAATRLLLDAATPGSDEDTVALPSFDVDHGDLVWTDGGVALVALAPRRDLVARTAVREHLLDAWPDRYGITDGPGRAAIHRGVDAAFNAVGDRLELSRGVHV